MDYVEIGGKKRPIHFGVNACRTYSVIENVSINEMLNSMDSMTFDQMIKFVYAAFHCGATKEKSEIDFTVDDVGNWFDDEFDKITECIEIMHRTLPQVKKNNPEG